MPKQSVKDFVKSERSRRRSSVKSEEVIAELNKYQPSDIPGDQNSSEESETSQINKKSIDFDDEELKTADEISDEFEEKRQKVNEKEISQEIEKIVKEHKAKYLQKAQDKDRTGKKTIVNASKCICC